MSTRSRSVIISEDEQQGPGGLPAHPEQQHVGAKRRKGRPYKPSPEATQALKAKVSALMGPVQFTEQQAAFESMVPVLRHGGTCSSQLYPYFHWGQQRWCLEVAAGIVHTRLQQRLGLDAEVQRQLREEAAAAAAATAALPRALKVQHCKAVLCALPESVGMRFAYNSAPTAVNCRAEVSAAELDAVLQGKGPLYVFRQLECGTLAPWVVIAPSAALASLKHGAQHGLGVYAWQNFSKGSLVGVYLGEVLGSAASRNIPHMVAADLHGQPYNAVLVVDGHYVNGRQSPWGPHDSNAKAVIHQGDSRRERVLFDHSSLSWPGMFAHLMNDSRATGRSSNVQVTEPSGVVQALRDVPAYDFDRDYVANAASELLWKYCSRYWSQ